MSMSAKRPRKPWEKVVRVTRARPERVVIKPRKAPEPPVRAPILLAAGFLAIIFLGSLLLTLPVSNREMTVTPYDIALFTATSAVCVTGLVVVDTLTYWSPFGQAVILGLIQVGGLGFITSSTLLFLLLGRGVGLRGRLLLREAQGLTTMEGVLRLTRQVVLVTLSLQAVGAVILSIRFALEYPLDWALWLGVFHSISAFNNAGFDLFGDFRSLTSYSLDPVVALTIGLLVLLGAISFTTIVDVAGERRFRTLLLDTKLVLVTTIGILVAGTFSLLLMEYNNPGTMGPMSLAAKLMNSFFMTLSRTSGFSTVNVGEMREGSLLFMTAMMFIGGASGSMGGGIKVNTFAVLAAAVVSAARGRPVTSAFGRELPPDHIYRALTIVLTAIALVFGLTLLLTLIEPQALLPVMFEAVSAFGIVGLSTGITPDLTIPSKLLLAMTMYIGRVGPLTLALALAAQVRPLAYRFPQDRVKIG